MKKIISYMFFFLILANTLYGEDIYLKDGTVYKNIKITDRKWEYILFDFRGAHIELDNNLISRIEDVPYDESKNSEVIAPDTNKSPAPQSVQVPEPIVIPEEVKGQMTEINEAEPSPETREYREGTDRIGLFYNFSGPAIGIYAEYSHLGIGGFLYASFQYGIDNNRVYDYASPEDVTGWSDPCTGIKEQYNTYGAGISIHASSRLSFFLGVGISTSKKYYEYEDESQTIGGGKYYLQGEDETSLDLIYGVRLDVAKALYFQLGGKQKPAGVIMGIGLRF